MFSKNHIFIILLFFYLFSPCYLTLTKDYLLANEFSDSDNLNENLKKPSAQINCNESQEDHVTVKTEKKNYTQNEIVQLTLNNNSQETIYSHFGSQTPIFAIKYIHKKNIFGLWSILYAQCQYPNCIYDIDVPIELKPDKFVVFNWTPLIFINGTQQTIPLVPGRYRLSILYQDYEKKAWKLICTNEFTIK